MQFHRGQLEGRIPKVDARRVKVELSTIYGVSGSLVEQDVKWTGDTKAIGSSDLRITSPLGSYHREVQGVTFPPPAP
jgi:hypothetical protein